MLVGQYPNESWSLPPAHESWPRSYSFSYQKVDVNNQLASLKNEEIYEFLRRHFDSSTTDELKDISPEYLLQEDSLGQTLLHWAAVKGDKEITQFIIEKTGDQLLGSKTREDGYTALHLGILGGNNQVVELLVDTSQKFNVANFIGIADRYGRTALHLAADQPADQGKQLVDLLIRQALTLSPTLYKNFFLVRQQEGGYTALHLAAQSNSSQSIQSLVNATKDPIPEFIPAIDHYGQTALHWTASQGNLAASTSLCDAMKPEDINIQTTRSQQTALHFAVQGGHLDVVKILIAKGADIHLKDVKGWTVLNWAQNYLSTESKETIISLLTVNT